MKTVIWIAALCFSVSTYAQQTAVVKAEMETGAAKKKVAKKKSSAKKTAKQTPLKSSIVEKDTLINGETVTMLQHEETYASRSRFEQMLAKRLEIDAAESRRKQNR